MSKELNRQMWVRFAIGVIGSAGVVWGASASYQATDDRSVRNEVGYLELRTEFKEDSDRDAELFHRSREQYHELKAENSRTEIRQQIIIGELNDVKQSQQNNHNELMLFVKKLEITAQ